MDKTWITAYLPNRRENRLLFFFWRVVCEDESRFVRAIGYSFVSVFFFVFHLHNFRAGHQHLPRGPIETPPEPKFLGTSNRVVMTVKINVVILLMHPNTGIYKLQGMGGFIVCMGVRRWVQC